jgi:hypothetical protein
MELITCNNPNDNSDFLIDLINKTEYSKNEGYCWVITDLDLIPRFHGDYMGNGGAVSKEIAYSFLEDFKNAGIAIMSYNELVNLFKEAQCVRNAVIVCFSKTVTIDTKTFRPRVETNNLNKLSHSNAKIEIRILDGDLFYVLKNN